VFPVLLKGYPFPGNPVAKRDNGFENVVLIATSENSSVTAGKTLMPHTFTVTKKL